MSLERYLLFKSICQNWIICEVAQKRYVLEMQCKANPLHGYWLDMSDIRLNLYVTLYLLWNWQLRDFIRKTIQNFVYLTPPWVKILRWFCFFNRIFNLLTFIHWPHIDWNSWNAFMMFWNDNYHKKLFEIIFRVIYFLSNVT